MDKEKIKRILIDLIDSADEIQDFSISAEIEEVGSIDGWKKHKATGVTNIYITTCSGSE